jgi:hypothetical protein
VSKERSHDGEAYDLAGATSSSKHAEPVLPAPSDPMAVARKLVAEYEAGEGLTMRWWRGGWMRHRGASWAEDEDTVIRKWIYQHLEHATYLKRPGWGGGSDPTGRWRSCRHRGSSATR